MKEVSIVSLILCNGSFEKNNLSSYILYVHMYIIIITIINKPVYKHCWMKVLLTSFHSYLFSVILIYPSFILSYSLRPSSTLYILSGTILALILPLLLHVIYLFNLSTKFTSPVTILTYIFCFISLLVMPSI